MKDTEHSVNEEDARYSQMWGKLKSILADQIYECIGYGSFGKHYQTAYLCTLSLMESIERGEEEDMVPFLCMWVEKGKILENTAKS